MSYTFSRRAFFKYSAAAAVAVAGMSLLGGCTDTADPNNPYATALGGSVSNLQVVATLEREGTDVSKGIFKLTVQNSRGNPLLLSPTNFTVSVFRPEETTNKDTGKLVEEDKGYYYSLNNGGVRLSGLTGNGDLADGKSATFTITAPNFPEVKRDDVIVLKYVPITTSIYAGYSMSWRITQDADNYTDLSASSTASDAGSNS